MINANNTRQLLSIASVIQTLTAIVLTVFIMVVGAGQANAGGIGDKEKVKEVTSNPVKSLDTIDGNESSDVSLIAMVDNYKRVIKISFTSRLEGEWDIKLVNEFDKVLTTRKVFKSGESALGQLPTRGLVSGTYNVHVTNGQHTAIKTIKID